MQPSTPPVAATAENLDDVLGRFHAWSNAHKASHKTREMIDGVRELSYEEALQSSRRRWQSHTASPPFEANDKRPANDALFTDPTVAPDTLTLSTTMESGQQNVVPAGKAAAPPVFGTILSEAVSPDLSDAVSPDVTSGPLALVWPAAGKSERHVSMSLRVAVSEQALIKARAAEAGLSVSAYLRQCALEVEKLRAQVHHTLALIEQRSEQNPTRLLTSAPPVQKAQPGLLARLRRRIFGRRDPFTIRV